MHKVGFQLLWAVILFYAFAMAQGPRLTGVEPATCKVGETLTVMGENLGEKSVGIMFANNGKNYAAEVVTRAADKITIKVPQVTPGSYNLALEVKESIYVEPIQVTVE
ncbi:MAG: IPT/TIG domain-containing protein [Acidobacteria bacterium]|nr:IPT/TIG domain-containing protein [Acidobacteriota bacterium]